MPKIRIGMPGHECHGEEHGQQRDGRAEVRLPRDDEQRHGRDRAGNQQVDARHDAAAAVAEELGEHQRQRPPWRIRTAAG